MGRLTKCELGHARNQARDHARSSLFQVSRYARQDMGEGGGEGREGLTVTPGREKKKNLPRKPDIPPSTYLHCMACAGAVGNEMAHIASGVFPDGSV